MSDVPRRPFFINGPRSIAPPVPSSPVVSQFARLFSVEQAASYLGISKRQVRYFIARGLLHLVRLDRRLRLDRAEVDRLVDRAMQRDLRPPARAPKTERPRGAGERARPGSSDGGEGSHTDGA